MYLGRVVEQGTSAAVLGAPLHPYTQALMSAVPEIDPEQRRERIVLAGDPPNPENVPPGCAFHPRCAKAFGRCAQEMPMPAEVSGRHVACHLCTAP
jgi:oligopeptide/dipeptide ABC transporter ATP-binding protein